ncbi:MAG: NAD(P)/FAD-dependent oxidoreductase, partial [Pseudomonadota bacterium]
LQTSSYWAEGQPVHLSVMAPGALDALIRKARKIHGKKAVATVLQTALPARLVPHILAGLSLPDRVADITAAHHAALADRLTHWALHPAGTEGYRTAEVMVGGVDTRHLSSQTLQATKYPGLYFIGECVDVTGWLGGYNFQWAWSSGWAAAQSIRAGL